MYSDYMQEFEKFSWNRDKKDLHKALELKKDLEKENFDSAVLNKATIFTSKLFSQGFQMNNLLQSEAAQDAINQLEIDEKNLNNNLNNKNLIRSFLVTADHTQRDLKSRFNDLWQSPSERAQLGLEAPIE